MAVAGAVDVMEQDPATDSESESLDAGGSNDQGLDEEATSWIHWFTSLRGNEFFCEVDEEYIQDDFNLSGLSGLVPYYDYALDFILESDSLQAEVLTEEQQEVIEAAAETLYGLIHARFILTARGQQAMADKFRGAEFGRCPRVLCHGQPCLPVGTSDLPRQATVKLFCPRCEEAYYPRTRLHGHLDGAFFGTTFAHLLLLTYPSLRPPRSGEAYVPRIFGFRIHPSARGAQPQQPRGSERKLRRVQPASRGSTASGGTGAGAGIGPATPGCEPGAGRATSRSPEGRVSDAGAGTETAAAADAATAAPVPDLSMDSAPSTSVAGGGN